MVLLCMLVISSARANCFGVTRVKFQDANACPTPVGVVSRRFFEKLFFFGFGAEGTSGAVWAWWKNAPFERKERLDGDGNFMFFFGSETRRRLGT